MKVLLVNSYDRGGAANACLRLHDGLLQEGIDSKVLLKEKQRKILHSTTLRSQQKKISTFEKIVNKFKNTLRSYGIFEKRLIPKKFTFLKDRDKRLEFFSFPDSNFDITSSQLYQEADIINLHWVADFLDYKSFFEKNTKPVVWTLHDMNPFTGGEHYEERYLGINEFGYPLKRIRSIEEENTFDENIKIKKQALNGVDNLIIVTPSVWLAGEARKSEVLNSFSIQCIPNGLDSKVFKSRDKAYSKSLFDIPKDKKVILFVADSLNNQRKGFVYLQKALEELSYKTDLILCAVGRNSDVLNNNSNIINLGIINDERLMSAAYSAADAFVIPSLMDNLPNTVLESLMCGTPVIGFPIGGISEMIEDGKNGLLAKDISVSSLKESLINFLENSESFDRDMIRSNAMKKYDQEIQAKQYLKLFKEIYNK